MSLVPIAGGIHGFIFLCYSASTIFVWVNQRWRIRIGLTGLLLAIVPFATVPFEIVVDREGLLTGDWRLAPGGEAPRGFIEHVQAWVLRHLLLSIFLLLLLVTGSSSPCSGSDRRCLAPEEERRRVDAPVHLTEC